ncbi:hypothetical protein COT72_00830 [archaeon CG10_big_fil_rev_8_21_14_0_10_43_11]|nr:MAG: hypothetical protein COT72_00830 [archaeon CG10_big_fil_rev_8_21_14_0_10_43_11]
MKNKHAIIFVPGVLGTELYHVNAEQEKNKVWPLGVQDVALIIRKEKLGLSKNSYKTFLELRACDEEGKSCSNIVTGEVINSFYGFFDFYQNISETFEKNGFDTYTFPYDWRLDVQTHDSALHERVEHARDTHESVSLVAHSLGALVARSYLKNHTPDFEKTIFVSPIHNGTPLAYFVVKTGKGGLYRYGMFDNVVGDLTANYPSLYQMCPNEFYFNNQRAQNNREWLDMFDTQDTFDARHIYEYNPSSKLPNTLLARNALRFHHALGHDGEGVLNLRGTGLKTLCYLRFGKQDVSFTYCPQGDGTVTETGSFLSHAKNISVPEKSHTALINPALLYGFLCP